MAMNARLRYDLFKNAKPYYGSLLEKHNKVPTLFSTTVSCILDHKLDYDELPTVLKKKMDEFKVYETFPGPKISKCSVCKHFYTSKESFDTHDCSTNHQQLM